MSRGVFVALALSVLPVAAGAQTVATVGKKTITRADVEKEVKPQLAELETQRYSLMRSGLDQLVAMALFEQEADARGTTVEALQKTEIVDKVMTPTDDEVKKFYDDNKEQLEGQPLDQVKDQLVEFMVQQRAAQRTQAFIAELKKKYPTKISMRPPTVEVGLGSRPPRGNAKAAVTIVEFSDYECPFCKRAEPTVAEVVKIYGDKIKLAYRDFPLPFHPNARPASEAAHCAAEQGKFWEYHEKLMAATDLSSANLQKLADEVKLDRKKFDACVADDRFQAKIDEDIKAGEAAGVNGTPAFFINGRMMDGAQPLEKFKEVIDEELEHAGG
jgi:protein-disulfide isomerase